ncbi:MAG TPA: TonB-dependent receptor [Ignavibacteriales bacterium]|nr:TonB-dependent receptor [Ignavibacteriales bacterium]HRR19243.1 TonB-dependent receptor [Ignavibacteriales bacterium]
MLANIKISHLLVIYFCFSISLMAQFNLNIKVNDSETHKIIENANILLKHNNKTILKKTSDTNFVEIYLDTNQTLKLIELNISAIGYKQEYFAFDYVKIKNNRLIIHLIPLSYNLKPVTVSCNYDKNKIDELYSKINRVVGKDLQKDLSSTLALSLKNQVGVAIRSMGPAPTRPVIRGLNSNRVEIAEDGAVIQDLSASSPDHATTIEPNSIESIEVVRGPKILIHTPVAIGGFINAIKNDIVDKKLYKPESELSFNYENVNNSFNKFVNFKYPIDNLNLHLNLSNRITEDIKVANNKIPNTFIKSNALMLAPSYNTEDFSVGYAFNLFSVNYGVPSGVVGAHPNGVDIDMLKQNQKVIFKLNEISKKIASAKLLFNRTYYHHKEFESKNVIGAEYLTKSYDAKIDIDYENIFSKENGIFGLRFVHKDFKVGGYVFTPYVRNYSISFYNFTNIDYKNYNFQFSYRFNFDKFRPEKKTFINPYYLIDRDFFSYSLSFSISYALNDNLTNGFIVHRSSRVPAIEELYNSGPHLAAYTYEVGNPNLKDEQGIGLEYILSYKLKEFDLSFASYYYRMKNYIVSRNTGKINYQTLLPIYQAQGVDAEILGFETSLIYKIIDNIILKSNASYTFAQNKTDKRPMPAIPPLKIFNQLRVLINKFDLSFEQELVNRQERVDEYELPTNGYCKYNFYAISSNNLDKVSVDFLIGVENITNIKYYNHLSRLKTILSESGRNIKIGLKCYL